VIDQVFPAPMRASIARCAACSIALSICGLALAFAAT
jgi:hypothetical protein